MACDWCRPAIVHTGRHYDVNMSDAFFGDLDLPSPHFHPGVDSGTHAKQMGGVMIAREKIAMREKSNWIVVVGGTPGERSSPLPPTGEGAAARCAARAEGVRAFC